MPDDKKSIKLPTKKEIAELKTSFEVVAEDFGKSLTKAIKKSSYSGAGAFRSTFLKGIQSTHKLLNDNFIEFAKKGHGDIAKSYEEALIGAQSGAVSATELQSIGDAFIKTLGPKSDFAEAFKKGLQTSVEALQLDKLQKDMKEGIKGAVTGAFDLIPKNQFTKALGIDFAVEAAAEAVGGIAQQSLAGVVDRMKGRLKDVVGGKIGLVIGALVVAGIITALVSKLADVTDVIGKEFGAIGVQTFKDDLMESKISAIQMGMGFEEVASSSKLISKEFGVSFENAVGMSASVLDTSLALGISTDNASTLTGLFMTMGGHSAKSAQNLMKQTHALAASVGLAPGVVMEDMASSSEEMALFIKDGGKNMGKAAVQARRMGMSITDASKMAEGLLEFESSLTAELEASVLLGRRVNLQKARELAFAGDLVNMQNEILSVVGSEVEFNNMNIFQRKALAAALSVEVSQLAKMVELSGKSADELARMGELDVSKIVGKEAISNISLFVFWVKSLGTMILANVAKLSTFFGLIDSGSSDGMKMFGAFISIVAALTVGLVGLFLIMKLGLLVIGTGLTSLIVPLKAVTVAGFGAIGVLLSIAAVGFAVAAIFYGIGHVLSMIPSIIDSLAVGFVTIIATISELGPAAIVGIIGLAGALYGLATALAVVGTVGLGALPVLTVLGGIGAIGAAIGLEFGSEEKKGKSEMELIKDELQTLNTAMHQLIDNFDKDYIPKIVKSNEKGGEGMLKIFRSNAK